MKDEEFEAALHRQMITGLPAREPDLLCANRVRARCHARIIRRKQVEAASSVGATWTFRRIFEPSLVAAACTVFLCEVLRRALMLYGL